MVKIVIFDLDLTLWNHPDASALTPPFEKLDESTLVDSKGEELKLHKCARMILGFLKKKGYKLAIASWNEYDIVIQVLRMLDLVKYFDFIVIKPHFRKEEMVEEILEFFKNNNIESVYFIDDNLELINRVKKKFPWVKTIVFGFEVSTLCDLTPHFI